MKLAPDRKKFLEVFGGYGDSDMGKFLHVTYSYPEENHKFFVNILNKLSKSSIFSSN